MVTILQEGLYTASLTVYNPVDSENVQCNISIVGGIKDIRISDNNVASAVNQSKVFNVSFGSTSAQSCVQVTPKVGQIRGLAYGYDPSVCTNPKSPTSVTNRRKRSTTELASEFEYKGVLVEPLILDHTYTEAGMQTMYIVGFDGYDADDPDKFVTAFFTFPITKEPVDCQRPIITIENTETDPESATCHFASRKIEINAEVSFHYYPS